MSHVIFNLKNLGNTPAQLLAYSNEESVNFGDTWHNSRHGDEITSVFTKLSDQQFVIEIYSVSKSFKYTFLGEMRRQKIISSTDNNLRNLPPSRDALLQRAKRVCYHAGYLGRETISNVELPDPTI